MDVDKFSKYRKHLHQNPELSGAEEETSAYIKEQLRSIAPSCEIKQVADNGLLVGFKGKEEGTHVMVRCELDALPIEEVNRFDYKSVNSGIAHKCGHDGHMAILLAVAGYLQNYPLEKGRVTLLFQPAEEVGCGARKVLEDDEFKNYHRPDFVFALHNVPGYPMHTIVVKEDTFTPSVISAKIHLTGKTSHAAEPEKGFNPSYAVAAIVNKVKTLQILDENSENFTVVTPIFVNVGSEAYGTSAGEAVLGYTLRTRRNSIMEALRKSFKNVTSEIAQSFHLKYQLEWLQEFRAVKNDKKSTRIIVEAAKNCNLNYEIKEQPFKWGEDFGLYTENFPGAMFGLGSGVDTPALHNPDYDFPDEITKTGMEMFIRIIELAQQ